MSAQEKLKSSFDVSRETIERLEAYAALLRKWNKAINLVGRTTIPNLWERHFLDSAQIFSLCPEDAKVWVDLGSGAGLPGLVVATLAAQMNPDLAVICIESDQRKATFLRTVIRELDLKAQVKVRRIEETTSLNGDVVSARALAPLPDLLSYAERHLNPSGKAIFLKGSGYLQEIEQAKADWSFDIQAIPSKTDRDGAVLILGGIRRE